MLTLQQYKDEEIRRKVRQADHNYGTEVNSKLTQFRVQPWNLQEYLHQMEKAKT